MSIATEPYSVGSRILAMTMETTIWMTCAPKRSQSFQNSEPVID